MTYQFEPPLVQDELFCPLRLIWLIWKKVGEMRPIYAWFHKEVGGAWLCLVLRGYTYAQFSFKQMCVAYSAQFEFEFLT